MMPRFISANPATGKAPIQHTNAYRLQQGFSLLEVVVVVALLALAATISVALVADSGEHRHLKRAGETVPALLSEMGEQSVFLGELLAVRLSEDRLEPLRYDPDAQAFVAFAAHARGAPTTLTLHEGLRLEWQATELEQSERPDAAMDLAAIADERLIGDEVDDDLEPPQIFFFPSGEATGMQLTITRPGIAESQPVEIELDTLGRARRQEDSL